MWNDLLNNLTNLWIFIGFTGLLIEILWIPGIGFLFLGLGALTNAIVLGNFSNSVPYQYINFGLFAFIWFALLWWPLKKMVYGRKNTKEYSDMIGKNVEVWGIALNSSVIGQVKFSGTVMNAKLNDSLSGPVTVGTSLKITAIEGNVLIVS